MRGPYDVIYLISAYLTTCSAFYVGQAVLKQQLDFDPISPKFHPEEIPSLSCMVFDSTACQYTCIIKCHMYGCKSEAQCTNQDICDCREKYIFDKQPVGYDFFKTISFEDAWNYKFVDNEVSKIVRTLIQQDPLTTNALLHLVRNPRISGLQLKNKFKRAFPEATMLDGLQPARHGQIDLYVNEYWRMNLKTYNQFLDLYVNATRKHLESMQIRGEINMARFYQTQEGIKYMNRQLLLFPSNVMRIAVQAYVANSPYTFKDIANMTDINTYLSQDSQQELTADQIDEILSAGVLSKLLDYYNANEYL